MEKFNSLNPATSTLQDSPAFVPTVNEKPIIKENKNKPSQPTLWD